MKVRICDVNTARIVTQQFDLSKVYDFLCDMVLEENKRELFVIKKRDIELTEKYSFYTLVSNELINFVLENDDVKTIGTLITEKNDLNNLLIEYADENQEIIDFLEIVPINSIVIFTTGDAEEELEVLKTIINS